MNTTDKAFILSAGFGTRLRPHTEHIPKPMVTVNDIPLIDHTINHLKSSGVTDYIINTHYKAHVLHDHYKTRDDINVTLSHEDEILDTGGGIKHALHHMNGQDFFVLSGDGLWSNGKTLPTIEQMRNIWDPETMDILLLLQPIKTMTTTHGVGDYTLDENGMPIRCKNKDGEYMFTSIRLNKASIFNDAPDTPFSYLELMDRAEKNGRLHAVIHDGIWHHISTPEDLENVRALYKK